MDTKTNPLAERMRGRVYDGADAVAATLEEVAARIRRATQEARRRSGEHIDGMSAEHHLVDVVVGAVGSMQPNLRLDRLVERLVQAEMARVEGGQS